MSELSITVKQWRYESGEPEKVRGYLLRLHPGGYREGPPKGWYCWVFTNNNKHFETWMTKYCPKAVVIHRYNSGDPMYTVYITSKKEAVRFQDTWICSNEKRIYASRS
jgi:hypothetical protein